MKSSLLLMTILCLMLSLGSAGRGNDLFQVISSHPHDLEEMAPYIDTVYQNGRLWVVQLHKDAPNSLLEHLKPLSGREKSYLYRGSFNTFATKNMARSTRPTFNIDFMVAGIEASRIKEDVISLSNYKNRFTGTDDNQRALVAVAERFRGLGFQVEEVCFRPGACNLVADKKGSGVNSEVLMVMAHIDSVGKAFAGADDNASGVAVMLEMARNLKDYSNIKNLRFFVTNGEEQGLIGSTFYVNMLHRRNELKKLGLVINMDMVGYNSNGIVELETDPRFEGLARWFSNLATRYTNLRTKITIGAWGSDHVPFLRRNVPALLTIEDWDTKSPCYHLACDTPDTLNYEYASEIAKLNLSAILTKDLE